ncbi:hypothetical protein GGH13_003613 [Coemansia sp. S155-1]|nr:hypothetical protein GGH13_003613 [Coemansia sp. S155-1]
MDIGTGPDAPAVSGNASISARQMATSIERHGITDSEIMRVTNGIGPRRRHPRWPEDETLSARRIGLSTASMPSFSDIDPDSPPPSPTMSLPLFSDTDSDVDDFDLGLQASSSSIVLFNERTLFEHETAIEQQTSADIDSAHAYRGCTALINGLSRLRLSEHKAD